MIPGVLSGIVTFFQVLPRIISVISQVGNWLKQREVQKWLDNLEKTMDAVEGAKSVEEKQNAARDLVRCLRSLK